MNCEFLVNIETLPCTLFASNDSVLLLCVDASDAQTVQPRTDSDHKEHAAPGTRETTLSQ